MEAAIFMAGATRGRAPIPMKIPRGQVGAGSQARDASCVMRNDLTVHVSRITSVAVSPNIGPVDLSAADDHAIFRTVYHILIPITSEKVLKNFKRSSEDMDM